MMPGAIPEVGSPEMPTSKAERPMGSQVQDLSRVMQELLNRKAPSRPGDAELKELEFVDAALARECALLTAQLEATRQVNYSTEKRVDELTKRFFDALDRYKNAVSAN